MLVTYKNPGFSHSVESILLFQGDDAGPYWSDTLLYFYPQIRGEKLDRLTGNGKREYITETLREVWDSLGGELDRKTDSYNAHFGRYRAQIEEALSEAFELDAGSVFNDLTANICLNPVSPRFLKERCFDVFYKNSERGALGMSLHEIVHFLWFYVWNRHFGDSYGEYEKPSLKWILSEMVVENIMGDERLASLNPYYPGCVYSYFQDMVIEGRPVLDTLQRMYRGSGITGYMESAFRYCTENEAAIRRHIAASGG